MTTTTLTRRQRRMLDTAAQRGGELVQGSLFDYDTLETEARIVVKQRTGEIKTLVRRAAQDIIEIGQKLIEVKEHLEHGQFGAWLKAEFSWDDRTARRFMAVAEQFKSDNLSDLQIAPSALYLLAAPSTPDAARDEALERAAAGETITHQAARQIVEQHRPPAKPERVADVALPADVVAALDAAANAAPGTDARRKALAGAVVAVVQLPNGDARALAMERYQQLDAEHYAVIGQRPRAERPTPAPAPHDDDAATLAGAGWAPHASKARTWVKTDPADGMLWEMELADDADLARTAQLIRERPDLDPDDLMLAADGAEVPSVEEADRVAMLASLDYVIDDLTAAGYTVTGWERDTPQGTVYTLRRESDVSRHTLHGLMLMLEATTPKAAAPGLDALLGALSRHGWDRVGAPRQKGATTFHTFRQADDERELAEGELSFWLADLDRSSATWAGKARHELAVAQTAATERVAEIALTEAIACIKRVSDADIRAALRAEYDAAKPAAVASIEAAKAKLSAAEARTVAGAQQQRQANASNPAWKSEGDRLARDLQEADDRGVVLTIAALFDGDGDGLPLASPGELASLEAHLVRAARAWAMGWLVKVEEATA